ncbi:hypothetical protein ACIQ7Q_34330 [Streptomyces sp. NPDC096176]|uniref:hypothetical protein n=1 Tax=Streptomyces sp. NPDC096176 TaxID=3366079 RepID=UPI003815C1A5
MGREEYQELVRSLTARLRRRGAGAGAQQELVSCSVLAANAGHNRDWSWPCDSEVGGFNPYGWNATDQARFTAVWCDAADDLVDELIEAYGAMWPWVCPSQLLTRLPDVAGAIRGLTEHRMIGQGHTYRDKPDSVYEHAAMYGAFHAARSRRVWPDSPRQVCPLCRAPFTGGQLNPWMIRQFGPARWCKQCCTGARDGNGALHTPAAARQAVVALAAALGTVPPQNFAQSPVAFDLPDRQRDAIVTAMAACPPAKTIRALHGTASWLDVLRTTEIVGDAWRPARGTYCSATDGHPCRSLAERTIDDWLTRHGISHQIEPLWPKHPRFNPHGRRRADWQFTDGTYLEYAGLNSDDYVAKIQAKQDLARATGIRLVVITPPDLANLTAVLGEWIPQSR